jgi:hypothetical protein
MQTIPTHFIFEELADLLAGMAPERVLAFRTSAKAQQRLEELLWKNKSGEVLTVSENLELEQFMLVEHIVSLAKARALNRLSATGPNA